MKNEFIEQFKNPGSEFRGAPFWAWNCKLDKEELLVQIDYFKEMGMGGFHMHCRTGMDTPYMSEEFLDLVKACVEKAKENDMKAYLYDEDRWPSGAGGGEVTKEEKFRSRYLVFTPISQETRNDNSQRLISSLSTISHGNGTLLARYEVILKDGYLDSYRILKDGEESKNIWYAYLEISLPSPWFNNQTYVNTLDRKAIERFIETTHEKYYKAVGDEFGKTIPSIFTDEPQFVHKSTLGVATEKKDIVLPYTDDFEDSFKKTYGESFLGHLPEVIWELPNNQISVSRYHYHDHLAERFASAFADTLGKWCGEHNIMLTGHMMAEETLQSQTSALGEAMRNYRGFELPGIDILCDRREYTTAKQAQSATHQMGRKGVISELYGVTNWDYEFRNHKLQGDWQAALGITTRVHHLSWVSMAGEAKRDYPASIFYQSPWYEEYNNIETHFARVNTALMSGNPHVKVGVIHPVESYWLHFGPLEQTSGIREQLQDQFENTAEWLLFGLIDFDYISEALLPDLADVSEEASLKVGQMNYEVIVLSGCETLRKTTYDRLQAFSKAGGTIIIMGAAPKYIDAQPSDLLNNLTSRSAQIPFNKTEFLSALSNVREVEMYHENGTFSDDYLYQMRDDGEDKWLFLAKGKKVENSDIPTEKKMTIYIKGYYEVTEFNTVTGEISKCNTEFLNGKTKLEHILYDHDSLLLNLCPSSQTEQREKNEAKQISYYMDIKNVADYALSEPNVLLLDQAEFSLDDEAFRPREEVLRIDNILRTELNLPLKMEALAQPWVVEDLGLAKNNVRLKYTFNAHITVADVKLAVECPQDITAFFNDTEVDMKATGWFVDKMIHSISLPEIKQGENTLILSMPYNERTNLEWCYLLGDFGVNVIGTESEIVSKAEKIGFGDWTAQKMPFYAGNVTYNCEIDAEDGEYILEVTKFRAPLLKVAVDGKEIGNIFISPYRINLGKLSGKHIISITAYGSRINAFGALHNCNDQTTWFGPGAWRSTGTSFSYEYQIRKCGILSSPKLFKKL